jgi:hypothetical protein
MLNGKQNLTSHFTIHPLPFSVFIPYLLIENR